MRKRIPHPVPHLMFPTPLFRPPRGGRAWVWPGEALARGVWNREASRGVDGPLIVSDVFILSVGGFPLSKTRKRVRPAEQGSCFTESLEDGGPLVGTQC